MTEKRFSYNVNKNTIQQDGKFVAYMNCVDGVRIANKLNVLQNENEQLRLQLNNCSVQRNEFHRGARENANRVGKLKKENKQLKSKIKEVTELLSEEVDLFSDKATEHDINAYVELIEFDNKDAYYMATATKKAIRMLKEL